MRIFPVWFALRGYVLAVLWLGLMVLRAQSRAPLHWAGMLPVCIGLILRLWAGAHLGSHGNSLRAEAPELIRTGPYRWVRNPLYLSNLCVGGGLIFFANCLGPGSIAAFGAVLWGHHAALVFYEERRLRRLHGSEYREFAYAVPRWAVRIVSEKLPQSAPGQGASWRRVLTWQGRNILYAVSATLLLWGAAQWR